MDERIINAKIAFRGLIEALHRECLDSKLLLPNYWNATIAPHISALGRALNPPDSIDDNPDAYEANINMREWVREALEAKGATCTGEQGGGTEFSQIEIEVDGFDYSIRITPRMSPLPE